MKRTGFTLIELTVTLAILVIAAGFVIVRVTGWSSRQALRSSARTLGNTIRTWRERARADETTYVLTLEGRIYEIASGKEVLRRGRLGGSDTFESGSPEKLIFSPRGILPATQITLRNEQGDRVSLRIGALSNEIEYQELP